MSHPSHHIELAESVDAAGRPVIAVAGDIDLETAPTLRERIEAVAARGGDVVIDLREVGFMDSPGLGTLIYCFQLQEDRGARLVVRAAQGHVRELFEVVALSHLLDDR